LPDEAVLALERQRLVRWAVAQLSPRCRHLLQKLFSDAPQAPSYRELAAGLGMPANSLGPTRARCLARLRRLLDDAGYVHGG
jgi:DNA-directed RNA polymerase specialized sigma24 family protein